MKAINALKKIIERCDLLLEGNVISRELLMQTFADFLIETTNKEKHNAGFVLHTGSVCYNAVAVVYAASTCLVYNEYDTEDIIASLQEGDLVLYKGKRYAYEGYTKQDFFNRGKKEEYILISQNGSRDYVPKKLWGKIQPYFGKSQKLDGRGVHKKGTIREDFYKDVLNYKSEDIPAVINASVALVMPRSMADFLIDKLALSFNGKNIRLLDLITASYFSENDEYHYRGNTAKTEAILKVSGKISVARQLIISREGNRHVGVIVFGNETVEKSLSELPELLNRKSLQYIYVMMNLDSENAITLIRQVENPNVFLCSKGFLLSNTLPCEIKNKYTRELEKQVSAVLDRQVISHSVEGWMNWEEYKIFREAIYDIKNSDYVTEEKENFIITAWFLMNLFMTVAFKITEIDNCVSLGLLTISSVKQRLKDLHSAAASLPKQLQERARNVILLLEISYLYLSDKCEKEEYLRDLLEKNKDKRIAIIVPKTYYVTVMTKCGYYDIMDNKHFLTIINANSFDNSVLYDLVIVMGNFVGKRFNAFKCSSSPHIETILYSFESNIYKYRAGKFHREEAELNSMNTASAGMSDEFITDETYCTDNVEDVEEVAQIEESIDDYISKLNEIAAFSGIEAFENQSGYTPNADVIAAGIFDSGERIFFTKFYKAYVFDESDGIVNEVNVSDLKEGDSLIFTHNTDETRDIVDTVLTKLVDERRVGSEIIESYSKSKKWKQILQKYMQITGLSAGEIAKRMIRNGVNVQEATIRGWLDEDSHTVGPREVDSIKQIALFVGDEEMFDNAQNYFNACKTIRKIRRQILDWIGEAIIKKISGRTPKEGTLEAYIYDRIDSVAKILYLESIVFVERSVPMNLTNRPINL